MARRPGMKSVPLSAMEKIVQKARKDQRDLYRPLSDIRIALSRKTLVPLEDRFELILEEGGRPRQFRLSETALRQLCSISSVPMTFLDRVPPSLGLNLVRCMLELANEVDDRPLLIRTQGKRRPLVRAALPQSFVRFDDPHLIQAVRGLIADSDVQSSHIRINRDTLFIRLLFDDVDLGTRSHPDPGMVGIDIINSETGAMPTMLRTLVLRQVCANGMTQISAGQDVLRQRHTGLEPAAFAAAVNTAIAESFSVGRNMVGMLQESRGEFIPDPANELKEIFRTHNLGSPRGKIGRWVMTELMRDVSPLFGLQRWHICQALTSVARGLDHNDRMRFEDAAGAYLMNEKKKNTRSADPN